MTNTNIRIKVPATSANMGPGFDSVGVALGLYLTLEIVGPSASWVIDHELGEGIPHDERNMVIETILRFAPDVAPHHLVMTSDIPTARGLGSSSSAIVAGIAIAEILSGQKWDTATKINMANELEGHPDNIAPAIAGGLVVSVAMDESHVLWTKAILDDVHFIAVVPHRELLTKAARAVLPKELSFTDAVRANGIGNVFVSKLFEGDLAAVGTLMEMDQLHEPFRASLVPELNQVRQALKAVEGVYGTYLSGAGPTVMTLVQAHHVDTILHVLEALDLDASVIPLDFASDGVIVEGM
jgi:homoserine kinase